ncbi:MAG: ectoine/hydroxyectoine ABC transporter ATP-binding protein EhuA [Planctomycetota bacterium]
MSEPLLRIRGLEKRYGDLVVLDQLDLDVEAGEKVAIIGPSGSGKSTLLRVLMTLERPDGGTIEIGGESLWSMERKGRTVFADEAYLHRMRRRLGMVFQHFHLFPHLDVLRNITLAPELTQDVNRAEAETRARELLELVGLTEKAGARPHQLSGGQKQRVAIARALALRPDILLCDEVTSALDPELVGEVLGVLREISRRGDQTMLIVTHEMRFARDIADRLLFFDQGRIIEEGKPEKVLTAPEEDRTREFLRHILSDDLP